MERGRGLAHHPTTTTNISTMAAPVKIKKTDSAYCGLIIHTYIYLEFIKIYLKHIDNIYPKILGQL